MVNISWIIGLAFAIIGNALQGSGEVVQKKSLSLELLKPKLQQRTYAFQPIWVLGHSLNFLFFVASLNIGIYKIRPISVFWRWYL